MKKLNSYGLILLILLCLAGLSSYGQEAGESIKWYTFEEAIALNQGFPKKKIFVDVYTDWCGWCKKMDGTTFQDSVVVHKMNTYFYAVKLDAERKDTVRFMGRDFTNKTAKGKRGSHELAQALLQGKMSYPSYVILNENNQKITGLAGYIDSGKLLPVLDYFGENAYFKMPWEQFQKQYQSKQQ